MTSFALEIEPAASPRLACLVLAVHLAAAASPWFARVPGGFAALLSAVALAGFASSLAAVPGLHHRCTALQADGAGCRVRLLGSAAWEPASLGRGSRVFSNLVFLDIRAGRGRWAWLLPRSAVPPAAFRRLKARVRLAC